MRRPRPLSRVMGGTVVARDDVARTVRVHLFDDPDTGEVLEVTAPLTTTAEQDDTAYLSMSDSGVVAMSEGAGSSPGGLVRFATYADLLAGTWTNQPPTEGLSDAD